ncbi:MAG: thiamine-phosphate kinase [Gammaproteobacteria bacterium]|nr:thiamine-phosphate kinase [Gammaproteobacteria bacterium]MBT5747482.1 thiamine-phosphate kinase [Gammaproteobacteria bacterium]
MSSRSSRSNRKNAAEFTLIREYFSGHPSYHSDTVLGIGDDAALLQLPSDHQLVVSIDTMVEGVHFFPDVDPAALGHKLLAVNLSDLAAMGAEPRWATLALTLPESNPEWLKPFSEGLFALAQQHKVDLVGGDTTRGPLTLTLQVHGIVPRGKAITRAGAELGEQICVTETLGAAGYALQQLQQGEEAIAIRHHLERPTPRIEVGLLLREHATAMIDLSDGLLADLGHITERSGVGAELDLEAIPVHPALSHLTTDQQLNLALTAGDDYELCFTLPAELVEGVRQQLRAMNCKMSVVGEVQSGGGCHGVERGNQWGVVFNTFDC